MGDNGVVIDVGAQRPPLTATAKDLSKLLSVMQSAILPITTQQVAAGNKVFGAAVLDKDWETVLADSNQETTCPLFHGEVKVIYEWSKKIPPQQTHEPCCMCISSIVWAGFNKCYYFFPYTMTAAQGIPHDIQTMHELWGVASYRKTNKFISTACIMDLVEDLPEGDEKNALKDQVQGLIATYAELSEKYHKEKAGNTNNSLVLG